MQRFLTILSLLLLTGCSLTSKLTSPNIIDNYNNIKQPLAVSASSPAASEAAMDILKAGGTAVDAFITAAIIGGNTEPRESGLGGGFLALYYDAKSKKVFSIDAREESPRAMKGNSFLDKNGKPLRFSPERRTNANAVGIPGVADGFALLHKNFGKLPLEEILEPAIRNAEEGFHINDYLALRLLEDAQESCRKTGTARMASFPSSRKLYFKSLEKTKNPQLKCTKTSEPISADYYPWQPLEEGDLLINKDFAKTLTLLRDNGFESFYTGDIAKTIVSLLNSDNVGALDEQIPAAFDLGRSTIDMDDLSNYRAVFRKPIVSDYRNKDNKKFQVYGMGPPSSGGIAIAQILNILDDPQTIERELDYSAYDSKHRAFLLSEALKIAFRDRNVYLADEDFILDLSVIKDALISPAYANVLRDKYLNFNKAYKSKFSGEIEDKAVILAYTQKPDYKLQSKCLASQENIENGTAHIVVADKYGNLLSATITIESPFGNGMVVPNYGFLLNNELTDFEAKPGHCNSITPGRRLRGSTIAFTSHGEEASKSYGSKRPRSSMSPTIVLHDSKPVAAFGAGGGSTIIGSSLEILLNLFELDMDIRDAINSPRLYNMNSGKLFMDEDLYADKDLIDFLEKTKTAKEIKSIKPYMTSAYGLTIDQEKHSAEASADKRRRGLGLTSK